MCVTKQIRYLNIDPVEQEKNCMVLGGKPNAVTNHFNLTDPARGNVPYKNLALCCQIAKPTACEAGVDIDDRACDPQAGHGKFCAKLNPEMSYEGEGNWMKWAEVGDRICAERKSRSSVHFHSSTGHGRAGSCTCGRRGLGRRPRRRSPPSG